MDSASLMPVMEGQSGGHPPKRATLGERYVEALVFWTLLTVGMAAFSLGLLVPMWEDYSAALIREQQMNVALETLQGQVEQTRAISEAVKTDPLVNEELALSELNYRRAGQTRMAVQAKSDVELDEPLNTPDDQSCLEPPSPTSRTTGWLAQLRARVPQNFWRMVCQDQTMRTLMMILGGGLVVLSLFIFSRRRAAA